MIIDTGFTISKGIGLMMKLIRTITASKEDRLGFMAICLGLLCSIGFGIAGIYEKSTDSAFGAFVASFGCLGLSGIYAYLLWRDNRPDPNDPLERATQRIAKMRQR